MQTLSDTPIIPITSSDISSSVLPSAASTSSGLFNCLNWVPNMRVAIDAVCAAGALCKGTICYTGDILDPQRAKYDLKYYVDLAKQLEAAGVHVLALKDMACVCP